MITTSYAYNSGGSFLYDATKIGFAGGVAALLDRRPANSTCFAAWTTALDLNWSGPGNGGLTVTPHNGAVISGGVLDLTGNSNKYVSFVATGNADFTQLGSIEFQYIPGYTNTPGANQFICCINRSNSVADNAINLMHQTDGQLIFSIYDNTGTPIVNAAGLGNWNPTAGVAYTFLIQVDITTGASKVFINGVQKGATQAQTGTRSGAIAFATLGYNFQGNYGADFKVKDFAVYNAVLTPPTPVLADTIYAADNPTIAPATPLTLDQLTVFTSVNAATGSDAVTFYLLIGSVKYWWDGAAWSASDGTYAQSNVATVIAANVATLPVTTGVFFTPYAVMHSAAAGTSTPSLTSLTLTYDYFGEEPAGPNVCTVYGYIIDETKAPVAGAVVTINNPTTFINQGLIQAQGPTSVTANAQGYFTVTLAETTTPNKKLAWSVKYPLTRGTFTFGQVLIPNAPEVNFADLVFTP